ncbi:hypothetical protein GUJ93_ZPchr0014g46592 [Zizania palustris]|uniref:Uncharacterized protein n=1 Tax=Zizania palustris TaxID=103762 RepID=A0A8J5SWP6_ZIZPA|nr:hypothetical protein GUJ93_ZPchr0014g46592 [Zizania palustris]
MDPQLLHLESSKLRPLYSSSVSSSLQIFEFWIDWLQNSMRKARFWEGRREQSRAWWCPGTRGLGGVGGL